MHLSVVGSPPRCISWTTNAPKNLQRQSKTTAWSTNLCPPPRSLMQDCLEGKRQVFKDHFVAVLCWTAEHFPMRLWYRLLRPAEHQLNLLYKSRVVPSVSVYIRLYGQHDYNPNPWAPLGTAVEMHVMPAQQRMFSVHTESGFYIGNSEKYYCCHQVLIHKTRATSVTQKVLFKH